MCCLSAKLMQRASAVNTSAWDKKQEPQMTSSALNFTQATNTILCYRAMLCLLNAGAALCKYFLNMKKMCLWTFLMDIHQNQMSELCFPKLWLSSYVLARYSDTSFTHWMSTTQTALKLCVKLNDEIWTQIKMCGASWLVTYSKSKCLNWYAYPRGLCLPFL